ncbi:MAG: molybdopterin-dependent oxidoreductase [Alphaproteobacteria bacterium]|nr:molybdopterin-dependent oxidoreductase [Alphaproteobacteria bacterium]
MISRRRILAAGAALAGSTTLPPIIPADAAGLTLDPALPEGLRDVAALEALPGKKPLIRLSYRPPNYEAPLEYFRSPITANDQFFVRYHLADIPEVDAKSWKLTVGGDGAEKPITLTLDDLKALPAVEVVAVNQCSGNRRGLFKPHVPGVEWGYGAMGCARWKGARLKDILDKAGLKKDAIEISFDGADKGVVDKVPDFVKSLPTWKAIEDTTIIAYEMNGAPLPHLNGFPARLIVPGWTGTYWMKHLITISALTKPLGTFWMASAYRLPLGKFPVVARFTSQETGANTPITEMVVNSLITSHADGASVTAGTAVGGLAWDGGYGITSVEVSMDGGKSWVPAKLGEDLGRFAFRPFSAPVTGTGKVSVMARATNKIGQTQTTELNHNPAGYHHNVIHRITLNVA